MIHTSRSGASVIGYAATLIGAQKTVVDVARRLTCATTEPDIKALLFELAEVVYDYDEEWTGQDRE
jgi:hypothetical protein